MAKVWFVTGSSRGLGKAIVEAALKSGAFVIGTARNPESLKNFTERFGSDKFLPLAVDVTDEKSIIKAVNEGHKRFGRIDIVVNNAGYANLVSVEDIEISDFKNQVETNFMGVVYTSKAVLPILRKQGSGHIFQVSSVAARVSTPCLSAYQSAKWAVSGFSSVLAQEVAPLGIKVTVLEPGGMSTDWAGSSMKIHPASEPYKEFTESFPNLIRQHQGQGSSIEKVAEIIITLSEKENPPVRLLLGPDAVTYAGMTEQALAASDKEWRSLSLSSAEN